MVSLGLCLLLQIWWFNKRFYGPFLFTAQSRYQAAAGYLKDKKDNGEINVPTFEEARVLESFFLAKEAHPVVYTFSYSSALQVLFDGHILVENFDSENPYSGGGHYLLLNPAVLKKKLIDKKIILRDFPVQVLVTPVSKWEVYAVSRK